MKYFGLHWHGSRDTHDLNHVCHDSSVTVFNEDGHLEFHGQLERYSRIKRDARRFDSIYEYFPSLCKPKTGDVIACVNNTKQKQSSLQSSTRMAQPDPKSWMKTMNG